MCEVSHLKVKVQSQFMLVPFTPHFAHWHLRRGCHGSCRNGGSCAHSPFYRDFPGEHSKLNFQMKFPRRPCKFLARWLLRKQKKHTKFLSYLMRFQWEILLPPLEVCSEGLWVKIRNGGVGSKDFFMTTQMEKKWRLIRGDSALLLGYIWGQCAQTKWYKYFKVAQFQFWGKACYFKKTF